ncbi:IS4 family transposase [Gracilibacillus salinarum]|uniref:IS4 family transposase n=1 Tax=Gracilibacillus salinarum TaxID=2932255 RepID=A0ABY4GLE2_9BACI|nr:IS4 family transposase [Gracilibacillus salinarum]UOQ85151.1 IS4 family transposase [Gracilibacillus salinarum]UOQ85178.1 IS4 family transposase [Gracilibacillus salinarum]
MSFTKVIQPFVEAIHKVLSVSKIRELARKTGFIERQGKLKAEEFLIISAFLNQTFGGSSLRDLCSAMSRLSSGTQLSKQALDQRFTKESVVFLREMFFQLAAQQNLVSIPFDLDRLFSRIRILDATSISTPKHDSSYPDGTKIQLEYELYQGRFMHALLYDLMDSDQEAARELEETIEKGDLVLRDLGYFSGEHLKNIDKNQGYYITRVPANQTFWTWNEEGEKVKLHPEEDGEHLKPGERIDYGWIQIGKKGKNTCLSRVVVQKLTKKEQRQREVYLKRRRQKGAKTPSANKRTHIQILATNVTQEQLDAQDLYPIYSLRWQIEILFKTWKSLFDIDDVRAVKSERFECHLYGTLIHILLSSMIAFQCRNYLYQEKAFEASEYKCIDEAKNAIISAKDRPIFSFSYLQSIIKNIYENICKHGEKERRNQQKSMRDILYKTYKKTFHMA